MFLVSVSVLIKSPAGQNYLTRKITEKVTENIDAIITFDRVNIGFFKNISFRELYIEDQQQDTLLFSKLLKVNLKSFNRRKKEIDFRKIEIHDARINFTTDSTNIINLKFITDRLKRKDTTKVRWKIIIHSIECRKIHFSYKKHDFQSSRKRFDLKNIQLSDLNFDIINLQTHNDSIDLIVENLKCRDKSGLVISDLDFLMYISPYYLHFHELHFVSPQSNLMAKKIELLFNGYKSLKDFTNNVQLKININKSSLTSKDLAFFVPSISKIPGKINLTGHILGYIANLKGKQIEAGWGENTHVYCDFALNGLPDINKTFIFIDIDSLQTTIQDIKNISSPVNGKPIFLPNQLEKLGKITYSGNFTGFVDDFVTYGEFNSALGLISTDLTIEPDTARLIRYSGKMKTNNFNLGKLFENTNRVGNITMDIQVNGFSIENRYKATLEGNIADLFLNKYHYKNINLSGEFTPKAYDGSVLIKDPNIELNFLGSLDFSSKIPEFDFTANVPKVNLYDLHIESKDTNSFLSFLLTANFKGKNLDDLEGNINLINSTYRKMDEELHVYDFSLSALNQNDTNQVILKTDFVDASITGNYNFTQLGNSCKYLFKRIIPSFTLTEADTIRKLDNHFDYSILLKDTRNLSKFLFPSFAVSPNSTFTGKFYPFDNYFLIKGEAEKFTYKGNELFKMLLNAECSDSIFSLELTGEKFVANNKLDLENFSIAGNAGNDTVRFKLSWIDQATRNLLSQIKVIAGFKNEQKQLTPLINISFLPTNLYINDSIWKINPGTITIDTTSLRVKNFSINNKKQWLKVHGGISEQYEDTLLLQFKGLNLSSLNTISRSEKIQLNGIINGDASLSNLYSNPLFQTNINIDDLQINNEPLGNTLITSAWDTVNEQLHLEASSNRGNLKTLIIKGDYEPKSKEIEFSLSLNKLRLNIFKPFISKISSELNGIATGDIILNGTLSKPTANGIIKLQKTSFLLDFFNTRYTFTDQIKVKDNIIKFEDIRIFDPEGNQAIINGDINNNYYKNFDLDLKILANNFLLMNTREKHNSQFYGTAYGSGIVNISGPPKDLNIQVSLKTDQNTRFFLPLSSGEELGEFNFVSFVDNANQTDKEKKETIKVKDNMPKINLDLEITPDAEAQLIFDSNTGDNIKSTGSGNLNLQINNPGELDIFGTYTIDQGEYLFSLQNIINKKFKVRNGGTITWNGNPMEANMDIEAVYETKASLYQLFLNEEYRRRILVECQLYLSGKIQNPTIDFGIELPTADQETKTNLQNAINTQEEMSKQFLSLIVINSFLPNTNYVPPTSQSITSNYAPAVGVTTSELLSNQLSNWLSQISNDFDIGFRYRPGDEISNDEVEVALSTQLLNDRVSINGNVDVGGKETSTNTSNIVGDFTVDVKINKSGKLRVKAFTRANDKLLYEWSPYTQGVGLFYREEFDQFDQLMQRYWNKIFIRKREAEKEK
ncbi:MAG: translocation/assembly module TamB [Bacteroidales bacterium]|nr:translocation/assembly module TamB [Bacteroidales bacterium]